MPFCVKSCCSCRRHVAQDEQLRVEYSGGVHVYNGPRSKCLCPCTYNKATKVKVDTLGNLDYAKIRDMVKGAERVIQGPTQMFMGPYEEVVHKGQGITCTSTEYVLSEGQLTGERAIHKGPCVWFPGAHDVGTKHTGTSLSNLDYAVVEDQLTGKTRTVRGPRVFFPEPHETISATKTAITLRDDEYIRLKDAATGRRWIERGKQAMFLEPTWEVEGASGKKGGIQKAWVLKAYEYVRLVDTVTGKVVAHRGEQIVFPEENQELLDPGGVKWAVDLKVNEYVKVMNQATGDIRVIKGPNQVFLGAYEEVITNGKQKAIEIDESHAALIRDKSTGKLRLETAHQLFFPDVFEEIEKVQDKIKLAEHEALIVKDNDGQFHYYYGNPTKQGADQPSAFFLPPYCEIVQLCWSRGRKREKRDLYIERFDMRAQFMSFEFNCRTADNVELVLEGTFFWEVVDLPTMVRTTGDTSGDICSHARSQFIRHVGTFTLKRFMEDLQSITTMVTEEDKGFYEQRGVKIHSLEVTHYKCADQSTCQILEQIIQETTNRMNRLSKAESENEVKLFQMQRQIEQEKLNSSLLEIQHQHTQGEAEVVGTAEAAKLVAFMEGLEPHVPNLQDRVEMWKTLRKRDALAAVAEGGATLYYTPSDVNLSIEAAETRRKGAWTLPNSLEN